MCLLTSPEPDWLSVILSSLDIFPVHTLAFGEIYCINLVQVFAHDSHVNTTERFPVVHIHFLLILQTMPPLLKRKQFVPKPVPADLKPDSDYFVCKATDEVFDSYE